jgi:hypothetical protein
LRQASRPSSGVRPEIVALEGHDIMAILEKPVND